MGEPTHSSEGSPTKKTATAGGSGAPVQQLQQLRMPGVCQMEPPVIHSVKSGCLPMRVR